MKLLDDLDALERGFGTESLKRLSADLDACPFADAVRAIPALIAEARAGRKLREACVRLFGREVRFGVSPHAILEYDRATSTGGAP